MILTGPNDMMGHRLMRRHPSGDSGIARLAAALGILVLLVAVPAAGMVIDYIYDDAGRLVKADYNNGRIIRYTYDASGNLTDTQQVVVKSLALLLPRPGTIIAAGSTAAVTWEAPAKCATFDLLLSLDAGATWAPIIEGFTGRSYQWTVAPPRGNRTDCLLKVVGRSALGIQNAIDVSDAPFTIQVLKVSNPKSGQVFSSGATPQIKWLTRATAAPVASVRLSYTKDGGLHWRRIQPPPVGNPGIYPWTVPAVASVSSLCRIKVVLKDAGGVTVGTATSSGWFTILP